MGKFLLTVGWRWGGRPGGIWGEATAFCLISENIIMHFPPLFLNTKEECAVM